MWDFVDILIGRIPGNVWAAYCLWDADPWETLKGTALRMIRSAFSVWVRVELF